jgi:hypothetical protein
MESGKQAFVKKRMRPGFFLCAPFAAAGRTDREGADDHMA